MATAVALPRATGAGRAELRLFLVLAGVVALHVADDSFLQPQPGTSAADHLVSVLVPLIAIAARPSPSGDDFTGPLSIPAEIGLLGLGVVTLWRSRRREGSLPRLSLRRTAIGVASPVVLAFGLIPLG